MSNVFCLSVCLSVCCSAQTLPARPTCWPTCSASPFTVTSLTSAAKSRLRFRTSGESWSSLG